jgi:hypothetical protein
MRCTVVRIAALVLGLLGGAVCAILGTMWIMEYQRLKDEVPLHRQKAEAADGLKQLGVITEQERVDAHYTWYQIVGRSRTYPFLLAALGLAVAGGMLTFKGRNLCGASLLFATVLGPAILFPPTLLLTQLLGVAAVLSLFVRPPRPAPAAEEE